jgi:hypothetical protein
LTHTGETDRVNRRNDPSDSKLIGGANYCFYETSKQQWFRCKLLSEPMPSEKYVKQNSTKVFLYDYGSTRTTPFHYLNVIHILLFLGYNHFIVIFICISKGPIKVKKCFAYTCSLECDLNEEQQKLFKSKLVCGATQIQVLKQMAFVWNGQKTQEGFYCGELVYAWDNCMRADSNKTIAKALFKFDRKCKQFDKYENREWAEEFEKAIPRKTKTYQLRPESFSGMYSDELVEPKKKQSCPWVSGNKRKYADSCD